MWVGPNNCFILQLASLSLHIMNKYIYGIFTTRFANRLWAWSGYNNNALLHNTSVNGLRANAFTSKISTSLSRTLWYTGLADLNEDGRPCVYLKGKPMLMDQYTVLNAEDMSVSLLHCVRRNLLNYGPVSPITHICPTLYIISWQTLHWG